eukprot:m.152885 g.152885  ORF g.152885 m.152885 type:complete len:113 (+) comp14334_c0_seq1:1244-1582(+)
MDHGCSIVSTSHESLSAPHTDCTFAHSSTASRNNLTVEGLESLLRIALYQATHCAASDTEDPPTVLQGKKSSIVSLQTLFLCSNVAAFCHAAQAWFLWATSNAVPSRTLTMW